jgi:hypothetical protein
MNEMVTKWLEEKGYLYIEHSEEESTEKQLIFYGEDSRGFFLEFKYDSRDGYVMDRNRGSKYWDITGKVS